jgi:hypothetical protein
MKTGKISLDGWENWEEKVPSGSQILFGNRVVNEIVGMIKRDNNLLGPLREDHSVLGRSQCKHLAGV